jgi:uncharacterized protein
MSRPDALQVIRFDDRADEPWANGGGSTRVIARGPHADGVFDWRLSIATVTSGDFSTLPGVDRIIVLVDGPSMSLTIDGAVHALEPLRPKRFAGESRVAGTTPEPALDFNVMTRRAACRAEIDVCVVCGTVVGGTGFPTFVVALAGAVVVRAMNEPPVRLDRFDAVRVVGTVEVNVDSGGSAAVVRVISVGE